MTIIAIGGARATSDYNNYYTTRAYDLSGNLLWSDDLGGTVWAVRVTPDDYVIAVGSNKIRKYNSSGTIQWTVTSSNSTLYAMDIDSSGNIYVGGSSYSSEEIYYNITKYDSSGNFLCRGLNGDGDAITGIAVGTEGIYAVKSIPSNNAKKYNTSLDVIWTRSYNNDVLYGVTVDFNDNVTVCGYRSSGGNIRNYDSSGSLRWYYQHGTTYVYGVTVDTYGNVYFAGSTSWSPTRRTGKLAVLDGSLLKYSSAYGGALRCIALSPDQSNVVVGGIRYSTSTHSLLDSDLASVWTKDHYDVVYSVAFTKASTSPPAPTSGLYNHANKLLSLGLNWTSTNFKISLVGAGYSFDAEHTQYSDISSYVITTSAVSGVASTNTILSANYTNFTGISSQPIYAILYADTTISGITSPLLSCIGPFSGFSSAMRLISTNSTFFGLT